MAGPVNTGMEKADMKRLLTKSKSEPVHAAIAQGAEPGLALLLMDKIKQPKALEKELLKAFPDAKNPRFGTAFVDTEIDPKLARFRINKPGPGGIARRLVKTLKGTGFSKVEIVLDDDTVVDSALGEEEEEAAQNRTGAAEPAPPVDLAALTRELAALLGRIGAAAGTDAARKAQLVALATEAQTALRGGNADQATAGIGRLRQALQAGPDGAAGAVAGNPAMLAKSRLAWLATRKRMQSDIDRLLGEIVASFPDQAAELSRRYRERVAPVLDALDASLADQLDAVVNAEPARRPELAAEARATVQRYEQYLASTTLIAELDDNPFAPLSIRQVATATLGAIAKAVQ
ncbi:MAG: hypothetical protein JOZ05_07045 [Acetobacteraceae bacterium]|nr:hypothetical protein [Acetobacteraceae bacterium]